MTERKEPIVDLDQMERTILSNQAAPAPAFLTRQPAAPATANGGDVAAAMSAIVDQALLPDSIRKLCEGMERQFGATANMMRNNAQALRLRADLLDQTAEALEASRRQVTGDLKDIVGMERRAYQMNEVSSLQAEQIAPETPRVR